MDLLDLEDGKRARVGLEEFDGCGDFPQSAYQQVFSRAVQFLAIGNCQNDMAWTLSRELLGFFKH